MRAFNKHKEREHLDNCTPEVMDFQNELLEKKHIEYTVGSPIEWRKQVEDTNVDSNIK